VEAWPMCWWLPPPCGCSTGFMATPRTCVWCGGDVGGFEAGRAASQALRDHSAAPTATHRAPLHAACRSCRRRKPAQPPPPGGQIRPLTLGQLLRLALAAQ
jgi:hypothetical protein